MKKLYLLLGMMIIMKSISFAQSDQTWIDLDGTNDFLNLGTDSVLSGKTQFTVEVRMHFDNSTGDYTIIGQRTSDANRTIVLQRWSNAFYVFLSNGNWGTCSFIPCEATVYHLAIVFNGNGATNSDRLKLYINGSLQTLTFNGTVDPVSYTTSPAANLVLGCEHNDASTQLQFVDGQIGEFCVWNYPLTAVEISSRVVPEVIGTEPGLVEYFHFGNGIPNGNNIAITSFNGGNNISTITPTNMAMSGNASNFVGIPELTGPFDPSVTVAGAMITSNAVGTTYQWLNCTNNFVVIAGATGQSYTATTSGSYAVLLTQGSCTDTSACTTITLSGISNIESGNINIYPNPVMNQLIIENKKTKEQLEFEILTLTGQIIYTGSFIEKTILQTADWASGIYFLKMKSGKSVEVKIIIKE
ncbi:MAG: LamG-like jellyroll fold domain-containing protein [Bacteroidota bacterium]